MQDFIAQQCRSRLADMESLLVSLKECKALRAGELHQSQLVRRRSLIKNTLILLENRHDVVAEREGQEELSDHGDLVLPAI